MKLAVTLIALGSLIVAAAVLFAYGERSSRESAERQMEAAIQEKVAAENAADLAEEELAEAVEEKVAAENAADLAEEELAEAVEEKVAAEKAAGLAEEELAEAVEEKVAAEKAADLAERELAEAVEEAMASQRAVNLAENEKETALRVAEEADRRRVDQEKARVLEMAKTQPLVKAVVTGELKFYIEPPPSYAGEGVSKAVEDVADSFLAWSRYGATVRRVYSTNNADLTVGWVRDYGTHVLGQAIFASHIKVGLGTNNCIGEWMAFDPNTIKKILWHELGHSMGYGHSPDLNNVMYEYTDTRFVSDHELSTIIAGGWWYSLPLCDSGKYHYSFETEQSDQGFNLFVLPPETDPHSFAEDGGKVYTDCGKERMHRFSGTCNVANGAKIYLKNTSDWSAIRLEGTVIHLDAVDWPEMTWDEAGISLR